MKHAWEEWVEAEATTDRRRSPEQSCLPFKHYWESSSSRVQVDLQHLWDPGECCSPWNCYMATQYFQTPRPGHEQYAHTRAHSRTHTHTVFNRFLLKLFSTSSNFLDVFWAVYSNLCAVEKHCHGLSTCPRLTVTSMSKFCLPHLVPFCKIIHCCTWMGKIYHKLRKHTLSRME